MKVRTLMTHEVVSARPETPLREAAALLVQHGISGLPIVNSENDVVGVLSEFDIVMKTSGGRAHGGLLTWILDPEVGEDKVSARTAGEAMSSPAVTIGPGRPVHEAARLMVDESVNRLPVVEHGKLIGILTRADIVRAFTRSDLELAAEIRDDVLRRTFWTEPGSVLVDVEDGSVTLKGEVETASDAELLPLLVSRVPGVVAVQSDLRARTRAG